MDLQGNYECDFDLVDVYSKIVFTYTGDLFILPFQENLVIWLNKNNDFKFNYDSNRLFSEELCNVYQKYNWNGYNVSNSGIFINSNKNAFFIRLITIEYSSCHE